MGAGKCCCSLASTRARCARARTSPSARRMRPALAHLCAARARLPARGPARAQPAAAARLVYAPTCPHAARARALARRPARGPTRAPRAPADARARPCAHRMHPTLSPGRETSLKLTAWSASLVESRPKLVDSSPKLVTSGTDLIKSSPCLAETRPNLFNRSELCRTQPEIARVELNFGRIKPNSVEAGPTSAESCLLFPSLNLPNFREPRQIRPNRSPIRLNRCKFGRIRAQ